ncbi:hypothetical protein EPN29_05315 [bacterium]|nr:MAG: hypothetical protein EPN29_05315 [bacterium]
MNTAKILVKGVVENLVGYAQRDLVVPEGNFGGNVAEGNRQAKLWGIEVNARLHSETQAVPAMRLEQERQLMRPLPSLRPAPCRGELRKVNKTQTIRFGSARYSLPTEWVDKVVEVSVVDHQVVLAYDGRQIDRHPLRLRARSPLRTSTTRASPECRRGRFVFAPEPSVPSSRSVLQPKPSSAQLQRPAVRAWPLS